MTVIRLTVAYYYERYSRLKKDGTAAVGIQAYLGGKERFFNAGIYITPQQWHTKLRQIVHHPDQFILNQRLQELKSKLERHMYELHQMGEEVSLDRLRDYEEETLNQTFTEFYEAQLEKERPKLSRSTYTDQRQTLEKFKEYRKSVSFRQFTVRLVKGFIDRLHAEGLHQNTVHKHFKNLRKYARLAVKLSYLSHDHNPCGKISVTKIPTDRSCITAYELSLFESYEAPKGKEHLNIVRDMFVFSCMTGLRFSDLKQITDECMDENPEGIELYLRAHKTKKPYRQNLRKLFPDPERKESRPEQILLRRCEQQLFVGDPLFVYKDSQVVNRHLKTIARSLNVRDKVKREISIHMARHTFASIMVRKVDVEILQKLMQHSNIRETMIYVHLFGDVIDQALDDVRW